MVDVTEQEAALPDVIQTATWLEQTVPWAGAHVAEAEAVEVVVKEQTLFVPLRVQVAKLLQTVPDMVLQAEPTDAVVVRTGPPGPAVTLLEVEDEVEELEEAEEDDEDPDAPTSLPVLSNGLGVPGKA